MGMGGLGGLQGGAPGEAAHQPGLAQGRAQKTWASMASGLARVTGAMHGQARVTGAMHGQARVTVMRYQQGELIHLSFGRVRVRISIMVSLGLGSGLASWSA